MCIYILYVCIYIYICICVCVIMCMSILPICIPHMISAHRGQQRASDLLDLELHVAVSSHADAESCTQVLYESNRWPANSTGPSFSPYLYLVSGERASYWPGTH